MIAKAQHVYNRLMEMKKNTMLSIGWRGGLIRKCQILI